MADYYVSSGVTSSGLVLQLESRGGQLSLDYEYVLSGGTASATVVSAGSIYVSSGGVADGTTIIGYEAEELVYAGGYSSGAVVSGGGEAVFGSASDVTVSAGGTLQLGGSVDGAVISSGGELNLDYGSGTDVVVQSGGKIFFNSPGALTSSTLDAGVFLVDQDLYPLSVTASLTSNQLVVTSNGQTVLSFGLANEPAGLVARIVPDTLGGDGAEIVIGSEYVVSSGVTSSGVAVGAGATLTVLNGGTAVDATIGNGGQEVVSSGGFAVGTVITDAGYEYVLSGGTESNAVVSALGTQVVSSGGVTVSTTLDGGFEYVGGVASAATVNRGGTLFDSGGTLVGCVVNSSGVIDAGSATGDVVNDGGQEDVFYQGVASGTQVNSGGVQYLSYGATGTGTVVESGGMAVDGGTLTGAVLSSGAIVAVLGVYSGSASLVGNTLEVSSNGTVEAMVGLAGSTSGMGYGLGYAFNALDLFIGSSFVVSSGATASGGLFTSGDMQTLVAGGVGSDATVGFAGTLLVSSGGVISGDTITSGGFAALFAGGSAADTTIDSGAAFGVSGGIESGGVVAAFGDLNVSSGGEAAGDTVQTSGFETVFSGGVASGTDVQSGGAEVVSTGGSAAATVVGSGATLVDLGGVVSDLQATSGSVLKVILNPSEDYLPGQYWVVDSGGELVVNEFGSSAVIGLDASEASVGFAADLTRWMVTISTARSTSGPPITCRRA